MATGIENLVKSGHVVFEIFKSKYNTCPSTRSEVIIQPKHQE